MAVNTAALKTPKVNKALKLVVVNTAALKTPKINKALKLVVLRLHLWDLTAALD